MTWDRDLYASPYREKRRADTSTRPLERYERCAFVGGHKSPRPAGVVVAEMPVCIDHGIERWAAIVNELPNADAYEPLSRLDPDTYTDLMGYYQ